MAVGTKLKDLFWTSEAASPAPPAVTPRASPAPAPSPPPADFAGLYARDEVTADARTDQLLAAYASMSGAMPDAQLAIAIAATASAIGATPKLVAQTLAKRLLALEAAIGDEQRRVIERRQARGAELAAATTKAKAELAALQQRIATLDKQLAAATTQVRDHDATEQGLVVAFEQRARGEAARLTALRDFLATTR